MTHRYLMDEHPHFFYPTLAEKIGLNEAIVLQQIHSWIQTYTKDPKKYQERHWHDDAWWIWNSYPDWHEKLPYLSESTIARTLKSLRKLGVIKTDNYNKLKIDRTLWYTIDYAAYDKLWQDQDTKTVAPSCQNGRMQDATLTGPLPSSSPDSSSDKKDACGGSPDEDFFGPDGKPPTTDKKLTAEEFRSRHAHTIDGLGREVEGKRAQVEHPDFTDAGRDGDVWANGPVTAWCSFIDDLPDARHVADNRKSYFAGELQTLAGEVHATPAQVEAAIRRMDNDADDRYKWLRTAGSPKHGGFSNILKNLLSSNEPSIPDLGNRGYRTDSPGAI